MSTESPSFEDDQAAIEHALLWEDLKVLIKSQSHILGVSLSDPESPEGAQSRDKVVLQTIPQDGLFLQLWGLSTDHDVVGDVRLSYQQEGTGIEKYMYEVTPAHIVFYGRRIGKPKQTTFDREEIAELRAELQEVSWDAEATRKASETYQYFLP